MPPPDVITAALTALGKRNLVLSVFDPCLPSEPDEDTGRGTPYGRGGGRFLRFARDLGFTGVLFGPQGQTSRGNQSPYDGTFFSKNVLSIALLPLCEDQGWAGLLPRAELAAVVAGRPRRGAARVAYAYAYDAQRRALAAAFRRFQDLRASAAARDQRGSPRRRALAALDAALSAFRRAHEGWLLRDALYEVLSEEAGGRDAGAWPGALERRLFDPGPGEAQACVARRAELLRRHGAAIDRYLFCQFVLHRQHQALRRRAAAWGLKLYGDLQIGMSCQDRWSYQALCLPGYLLGAPPSRTNPAGQPWGYPVLDPALYRAAAPSSAPGPALRLLSARVDRLLAEFDGVRIDHPHGLVCPWVYRADDPDPLRAVQRGARLFASPRLPELADHPALWRYAIARPDQIDRREPRHADGWVTDLDPAQIDRYAALIDAVIAAARARGRAAQDVICEVLSTQPFPLRKVRERHGLGRFLVTQKADPSDPADGYRSDSAAPPDWIMVGNHDTRPLWALVEDWQRSGHAAAQARYLAERLCPDSDQRPRFAAALAQDPRRLAQACFADLLASRAQNVLVFFTDLLGMRETYNRPGVIDDENWTLRVPPDYPQVYARRRGRGQALDLPRALTLALRARGVDPGAELQRRLMGDRPADGGDGAG